jgi:hypothetical protein
LPEAALRERLGRRVVVRGTATAKQVDESEVSELHVPDRHRLADVCSSNAVSYGVTREIHVVTPYAVTQQWALAFRATRVSGLRYDTRFSTGRHRAYALFGDEGVLAHGRMTRHRRPGATQQPRPGSRS